MGRDLRSRVSWRRKLWPTRKHMFLTLGIVLVVFGVGAYFLITALNKTDEPASAAVEQYREQLPDLQREAQENPNNAAARREYGVALYVVGDTKKAADEYEAALEINGNDAVTYNNLGNAYRDLGNIDKATKSYKKASEINPKLVNPYVNLASIQQYSQNKIDNAIQTYEEALTHLPDNDQIRILLALAHEQKGDDSAAKQIYKNILANDPDNTAAKANLDRLEEKQ